MSSAAALKAWETRRANMALSHIHKPYVSETIYPSKLRTKTVEEWLRDLKESGLNGACIEIDGAHVHVDIKVIGGKDGSTGGTHDAGGDQLGL